MADAADFRRLALALPGTAEAQHVDRRSFRARVIYATLSPDEQTANLRFTPEDQAFRCEAIPHGFAPVPGGWGKMGWTTVTIASVAADELASALEAAWRAATTKPPRRRG